MLRIIVEDYVDDLVIKAKKGSFGTYPTVFGKLRTHQLKMNPLKSAS